MLLPPEPRGGPIPALECHPGDRDSAEGKPLVEHGPLISRRRPRVLDEEDGGSSDASQVSHRRVIEPFERIGPERSTEHERA